MNFDVRTYSPSDVIMTFGGAVVTGWDSISVSRTVASFKTIEGIRGKNTRVRLKNSAAIVEISLPVTSDLNIVFSEIVNMDERYGTGRIEVMIKDVLGGEVFSSTEAFLESQASKVYETNISTRVWKLVCQTSSTQHGDSDSALGSLRNIIDRIF